MCLNTYNKFKESNESNESNQSNEPNEKSIGSNRFKKIYVFIHTPEQKLCDAAEKTRLRVPIEVNIIFFLDFFFLY